MSSTPRTSGRSPGHPDAAELVRVVVDEVKPRLRGWLHAAVLPFTLAAGIVLVVLSPTAGTRTGSAIFATSALLLFTVSALFNCRTWSPRWKPVLQRLDHSSIFVLIAGSYTPFTLILLRGDQRVILLSLVWAGAGLGVAFRVFWTDAPRWLYTPIYLALGWAAVFFAPGFVDGAGRLPTGVGAAALVLLATGGLLYTVGAIVYGLKWPDPWPAWFGFHEVFHVLTVLAFAGHVTGVFLVTLSLR